MRFGSTRKSRARCQKLISTSSICAPAVSRTRPFGTVFIPSIRSSRAGSVGAIDLDEPDPLRLARAVVRRLRDHLPRGHDVAVVLARELADVRGRVVDDLAPEVLRDVLAVRARSGVDEPMFVCGAIAATSAAIVMTAPAESALEPGGAT